MLSATKGYKIWALLIVLVILLAACGGTPPTASAPTIENTVEPAEPRTLVYCTRQDPENLYLYGSDQTAVWAVTDALEAIYDGPIDSRGFAYQPVILEKLPNLADGDARLNPVAVAPGDRVVDASGLPAVLEVGLRVRPSGCQAEQCAVAYDGSPGFTMDQLSATFRLLPGLTWSDGAPLTAADSVYPLTWRLIRKHPVIVQTARLPTIQRTASYTAPDERTAAWVGLPGYLDASYTTNFWSPLPEHLWGGLSASELLEAEVSTRKPVGWGPYVISERVPGESLTLVRNERYFRADEGLPRFDRLVFRFVGANVDAHLARLLSGECDVLDASAWAWELQGEQANRLLELSESGQINAVFTTGSVWEHLDFGIRPASYDDGWQPGDRPDFFGDVRVRRAFTLCLDRPRMAEIASFGQSSVADSYLPPRHPLYNPNARQYEFDPAAGSALLAEAGWELGADGVRLYAGEDPHIPPGARFSVQDETVSRVKREVAQVMVDSLAGCGIEVNVAFWDTAELFAGGPEGLLFGRNFDLAGFLWLFSAEPPCDLYLSEGIPGEENNWVGSNNPGFSDPAYDRACRAALGSLPDQPGYAENHLKAQAIFAEQLPVVPLYFNVKFNATRPDFCGQILDPSESATTWNVEAFDYGPDC